MIHFPTPGNGYTIRELLGSGNWKIAYRASSQYKLADVALLYFKEDGGPDFIANDVYNLVRALSGRKYASYVAEFHGVQKGPDGRLFIIEELLSRPLDALGRVDDLILFLRIARDLCRGLTCLHGRKLVHRDLKLDNCGIDQQQRAKIFDLGSMTSDSGPIRGSVLTRAPELFRERTDCDKLTDVWALGATLFAARIGDYPFVYSHEVEERKEINRKAQIGEITEAQSKSLKQQFDARVASRILDSNAEDRLVDRIHQALRGRPKEALMSMLVFDRSKRASAEECEQKFSELAQEYSSSADGQPEPKMKWDQIKQNLASASHRELLLTRKQVARIISEFEAEQPSDPGGEIAGLLTELKSLTEPSKQP